MCPLREQLLENCETGKQSLSVCCCTIQCQSEGTSVGPRYTSAWQTSCARYKGTDILGLVEAYFNEVCNVELFPCDSGCVAGAPKSTKMKRSDEHRPGSELTADT